MRLSLDTSKRYLVGEKIKKGEVLSYYQNGERIKNAPLEKDMVVVKYYKGNPWVPGTVELVPTRR